MIQTANNWFHNHISLFITLAILNLTIVSGASGCYSGNPATPMGEVSGQVTLDGKPLESGMIRFHDPTLGNVAGSQVKGPDGKYQLSFGGEERIPTGKYLVTVSPLPEGDVDAARSGAAQPTKPISKSPSVNVPKKYQNQRTTDLTAEVIQGENKIDLELKSK